jgi:Uma2 family endonuclease
MKEIVMSTILEQPSVEAPPSPRETPYLFSVDEFYRMIELDLFPRESRVSLWEGQVYEKMAKTQAHAVAGINLTMTLARALPPGWCLSSENPITVDPAKAPLPDMVVLRGTGNDYLDRRPSVADVGLVVEVSMSSLKFDTGAKLAAYASASIPAYWGKSCRRRGPRLWRPDPVGVSVRLGGDRQAWRVVPVLPRWHPYRPHRRVRLAPGPLIRSPNHLQGNTRRCPPLTPPRWKPGPPSSGMLMPA